LLEDSLPQTAWLFIKAAIVFTMISSRSLLTCFLA